MLSNDYRKRIEPLRSREVQPSFEEIRSLVLEDKRSRKFLLIPFWLYLSASAPLLIATSILLFPGMFGLQRSDHPSSIVVRQSSVAANKEQQITMGEKSQPSITRHHLSIINSQLLSSVIDERKKMVDDRLMANEEKVVTDKTPQKETPLSVKVIETKTTEPADVPIHPVSELTDNSSSIHRFSLFISGGLPPTRYSAPLADILYGSAGIRYRLNSVSSMIFELRRNVFIQNYTAKKVSFHDTSLIIGNQTYHNTIGELSQVPVESANNIFSLGAGYRFAFMESGIFTPFAEVILGGSTEGALTSELAGIGYSFNSPFLLELALRSDQLFSRSASPQSAFNLNASLSFSW